MDPNPAEPAGQAEEETAPGSELDADQEATEVLSRVGQPPSQEDTEPIRDLPDRIGPYRIVDVLGEGGMGVVYLAVQDRPLRRRVALKLIRPSRVSREAMRRFGLEGQALARMRHPGIAHVHDVGVADGAWPFIAMELVEGERITTYCSRRKLSFRQRIELFASVCDAVQHAHQKAILHRDIKPSNVLVVEVDGKPAPKVIDFGLAKALDPDETAFQTAFQTGGRLMGTPAYLPPEAIGAVDEERTLDTRADVYSLGILLYELLAGSHPFEGDSSLQILKQVIQKEISMPSRHVASMGTAERASFAAERGLDERNYVRALRRDLDWIVLRAVAREPEERYGGAAEMAADLRRYLRHEPVQVGPPSRLYRLRKAVRRHRAATAAVLVAVLALVGGFTARTVEARRAEQAAERALLEAERANREAARANREARTAEQVADFLASLFRTTDPGTGAAPDVTARQLLGEGAERIRTELADEPLVRARLLDTIGSVYRTLGLYETAEGLVAEALAIRRLELGPEHLETLQSELELATVWRESGQVQRAEELLARGAPAAQRLGGALAGGYLMELGSIQHTLGHYDRGEKTLRAALALREDLLGSGHEDVSAVLNNLGNLLFEQKRFEEAGEILRRALEIKEATLGPDHFYLAQGLNNLANVYLEMEDYEQAQTMHERALAIKQRALAADHPEIGVSLFNLGDVALRSGKAAEAESLFRQALDHWGLVLAADHPFVSYGAAGMASARLDQGDLDGAGPWFRRSLEIRDQVMPRGDATTLEIAETWADALREAGRVAEADEVMERYTATGGR